MTIWFLFNQYASLKKMLLLTKRFFKVINKIFFFIELFPISEKILKKINNRMLRYIQYNIWAIMVPKTH